MGIDIHAYDLPDAELDVDRHTCWRFLVWQPAGTCVVLGHGNSPERALRLEHIRHDNIPVLRRPSGGQAVLLTPAMLVVALSGNGFHPLRPALYFETFNRSMQAALQGLGINGLAAQGTSDLTLNGQKIMGSAIYQNPSHIFLHAVLNVSQPPDLFERYLRHPEREPTYRQGRSHARFITSLQAAGYDLPLPLVRSVVASALEKMLPLIAAGAGHPLQAWAPVHEPLG